MVQEIGGNTDLPDSDETGHHSQRGELVFVSTEDYSLVGRNKDFEVSKESSGKRTLFRSCTHSSSSFAYTNWTGCPFDRRSTTGYCVFLGGNLLSWKRKKQSMISLKVHLEGGE